MQNLENKAPNLKKVIDHISAMNMFQKKAVKSLIENADDRFVSFAEDLVRRLNEAVAQGESHKYLAKAYLDYTKQIKVEEMYFAKEHKYRYTDFSEVYQRVYGRDDYMFDYVVGLGMTQIFWPNHWGIVDFFLGNMIPLVKDAESGAEIGVGHGLFHSELLRGAPNLKTIMLDISPTSLEMTHRMIRATGLDSARATKRICDIQKEVPVEDDSLDVLLMGELIEHIEDGEAILNAMVKKMKKGGHCFFTTAANAPAEDHILLFRTIDEIRDVLDRNGWAVKNELTGTLAGMSIEEAEKNGHNINYAAVLTVK